MLAAVAGPPSPVEPGTPVPAMVVIRSVNPEYQTYQRMAEEVHVIGRVVWTSRRL